MKVRSGKRHRPRRSREEWAALVEQSERSALSLRDFCAKHDIYESGIYKWRRRLGFKVVTSKSPESVVKPDFPANKPSFVAVRIKNSEDKSHSSETIAAFQPNAVLSKALVSPQENDDGKITSQFILHGGGMKLEFPSGCAISDLKLLVQVLSC